MRRAPVAALLLAAATGGACTFDPNVPSARVLCYTTADCPAGYGCETVTTAAGDVGVCCKTAGCAAQLSVDERDRVRRAAADGGYFDAPADHAAAPDTGKDGPRSDAGADADAAEAGAGATCGNGRADPGETCDPPQSCPQSCPPVGCELYQPSGSAAACNAACVQNGAQAECVSGDACCPPGCTAAQDSDCRCACGDGTADPACGETCDPLASCPTACAPDGCMLRRLANPGTCRAACVNDVLQTACISGDGCCPPTCNANNDSDCHAACGNGVVESGEACDPPSSCPQSCPALGCTKQKLTGSAAACTARCVDDGAQTACAAGDSCCPSVCNANNDSDCACTCGNGQVEPACGETCDPLSSCPASCPPVGCQLRRLVNGNTCQAQCVNDVLQTACKTAPDGCCPPACDATNDGDCAPRCGNGVVEAGETCDPPSSCPATCPWNGCTRRKLTGAAATCTARCADDGAQTTCAFSDGCCPSGCNATNDNDCAPRCGNGVVEAGEICDGNCPSACPAVGCQTRKLQGTAAACTALCVNDAVITACASNDGCCASGCTSVSDNDCSCRCGNGVTEAACAETCDGNCPSSCPPVGCQLRALQGSATACTAACVNTTLQTACASSDGCCPPGCNANNDNNCAPACGNGVVEPGEKCDPVASCTAQSDACIGDANTIRTRTGTAGDCTFECMTAPRPCSGTTDGYCPTACAPCAGGSCGAGQDVDCLPRCGNGMIDSGETCDPPQSCPTACPWMGCARRRLSGSAAACTAACVDDGAQTACANGDGCCPSGCNANNDSDCAPRCGNGAVEAGETCDGNCPSSCPAIGCQLRTLQGSAAACTAACVNSTVIGACTNGDGCCPSGCTSVNDNDCACRCGNGVVEPACSETCDGNCPTACPAVGCQLRALQGTAAACTATCVNTTTITTCASGDACCPAGCNAANDNNCTAVCGNSVVEPGETCDPTSTCQTQANMCVSDANTVRTPSGSVAACTFACLSAARACSATSDGFCPAACVPCAGTCGAGQDIDCKLANGATCTQNSQCLNNVCSDGHCCATSCPTCQNCNGAGGTCTFVPALTDDNTPAAACAGTSTCDGSGNCRLDNGQGCAVTTACASGFCADGLCCESACTGTCQSCANAGQLGLCRNVPDGSDDANGAVACTGADRECKAGACKTSNGFPCVASADCASGACTTFYTDADGDGFVSSSGSGFCGTTPPPGWTATQGNDCCDSDSTAYPGVTIFFSSPRHGCGGYDFNCSGAEEVVLLPFVVDPCSVDSCTSGWSSTVPDCGDSAPWQNCTTNAKGVCVTASPTTKIQICH